MELEFVCPTHSQNLEGVPFFMNDIFLKPEGNRTVWHVDTSDMFCPAAKLYNIGDTCSDTWDIRRK